MRKLNVNTQQSINENLETWCFEVGTHYESYSKHAAERFISYIGNSPVVDLGAGDGAATKVFVANGNKTTAVDINAEKLGKIKGAKVVQADFVSYLSKPVDNVFMHHSLEHCPNPEEVLALISKWLKKGCYCFIAVPKDDTPHSVHHVAFDSVDEIQPPGLELVESIISNEKEWKQYIVIARKV